MTSWLIFFADYLIFFILVAPLLFPSPSKRLLLTCYLSSAMAWSVTQFFKLFFFYPRPYILAGRLPPINFLLDGTFPSGHTAATFAVSYAVFRVNRRLGLLLFPFSFLVSASRVVAGVHYPVDVLGGLIIAWVSVTIVSRVLTNYQSR